jgi:hypothetical protein
VVDVDVQHDKHGLDEMALKVAQLARCQPRVLPILRIASAKHRSIELHQFAMATRPSGEGRVRTAREARAHRFLRIMSCRTNR